MKNQSAAIIQKMQTAGTITEAEAARLLPIAEKADAKNSGEDEEVEPEIIENAFLMMLEVMEL